MPTPKIEQDAVAAGLRIAMAQRGVISRTQAVASGMSKYTIHRWTSSGKWLALFPGVFRLAGAPDDWESRLIAACLWAGDNSVVSHRAAAALWRLDGCEPGLIEISAPTRRSDAPSGVILHKVQALEDHDATVRLGVPVTTPLRTLLDLAAVAPMEQLELALEDTLRRGAVSLSKLQRTVEGHKYRGRRGIGLLGTLLRKRGSQAPTESPLETRLAHLLNREKLPPPTRQFVVTDRGRFVARLDFAYPAAKFAIEVDGYRFHSGRRSWRRDRERMNDLVRLGWKVRHVTAEEVSAPARLLTDVRAGLGQDTLNLAI